MDRFEFDGQAVRHFAQAKSFARSAHLAAISPTVETSKAINYERAQPFRIQHLALDWVIDEVTRSVHATALLTVQRTSKLSRTLELDAVDFAIHRIAIGNKVARYTYDGKLIRIIVPNERAVVMIAYTVVPKRGLYFFAPDALRPERATQIWTQFQDQDARHVIPCVDDPSQRMTTELRVLVPKGMQAVANGELVASELVKDRARLTWANRHSHASYLLAFVCGEFAVKEEVHAGVPLAYWVPPSRAKDIDATFGRTARMLDFLNAFTGFPYPWGRYTQVVVSEFQGGGMENTSLTVLYEHTMLDPVAARDVTSDELIEHELAHHWFGNLVTCRDWSEGWLNEGFATYSEHLYREKTMGLDEFHQGLRADLQAYLAEAERYQRPIVTKLYDAPMDIFDRHLYEKASLFLHGVRMQLGRGAFAASVRTYLKKFAFKTAETRDLQRVFEQKTGLSLDRTFREGLTVAGHVKLNAEIVLGDKPMVRFTQEQAVLREVRLQVLVSRKASANKSKKIAAPTIARHTVVFDTKEHALPLSGASGDGSGGLAGDDIDLVVIDPRFEVLGELQIKAPFDLLERVLERGPQALDRTRAAEAMESSRLATVALVRTLWSPSAFWGTRVAAAQVLARFGTNQAREALLHAAQKRVQLKKTRIATPKRAAKNVDKSASGSAQAERDRLRVLRATVQGLAGFVGADIEEELVRHLQRHESHLVAAAAATALGKVGALGAIEVLCEGAETASWSDLVATASLRALGDLGLMSRRASRIALPILQSKTHPGYSARIRRAASVALANMAQTEASRATIEPLLSDDDASVRASAGEALATIGLPRARQALAMQFARETDPRTRKQLEEAMRQSTKAPAAEQIAELRRELDALRRALAETKVQIEKDRSETKVKAKLGRKAGLTVTPAKATGKRKARSRA
jgi:aminopeptidase N